VGLWLLQNLKTQRTQRKAAENAEGCCRAEREIEELGFMKSFKVQVA